VRRSTTGWSGQPGRRFRPGRSCRYKGMAALTGHFAYEHVKARRRVFLRDHWWRIGVLIVGVAAMSVLLQWLYSFTKVPMAAGFFVIMLVSLWATRQLVDGTHHLASGLEAERWTSKELKKWLDPHWHVVDWISFGYKDVDHVVVGPGGVFAVETKYTDSMIDLSCAKGHGMAFDWSNQALDGARSVRLLLTSLGHKCEVIPIVVVWGGEVSGTPLEIERVQILRSNDLKEHLSAWVQLPVGLPSDKVQTIGTALKDYRAMRVAHERSTHP